MKISELQLQQVNHQIHALVEAGPMDCSPPGSYVHGIFQARILEWGAIAFSESRHRSNLNVHRHWNITQPLKRMK